MNYQESLEYINSITWRGSVLGLSRVKELSARMGDPQKGLKFIHIGGTNGKGSTSAFLSSILVKAGLKVGLFISPYIEVFNERMQINNQNISDEELAEIVTEIRPFADSMEDRPTEFELNTVIAMIYFKRHNCDIVVLEVGMGGELDSTNVIDSPEAAVITAIGLDHTAELGDTIEKIAATKAGIIKTGCDAVLYKQADSVTDIVRSRCEEVGAGFHVSEPENIVFKSVDIDGQVFDTEKYGEIRIPLIGTYQKENMAVALKVIEVLNKKGYDISDEAVVEGLKETRWPGRFEVVDKTPVFIVDGGHNPHGIKATTESLKNIFKDQKLVFIFGVMADKDYNIMLDMVCPLAQAMMCVTPDNPRALAAEKLAEIVNGRGVEATACGSIGEAVEKAYERAGGTEPICALGSLYMIGDLKKYLKTR
ncbi:MAG: bifunctional folylpolyglutamate synthase/dihydrofolate synthase [Parasporobacterium sp.]|nr:bifunctional folylpolyglutamate synthase/dihydrofolate synthase [Parasporobacterium sp.]